MKKQHIIIAGSILSMLLLLNAPESYAQHQHGGQAGESAQPQNQSGADEEEAIVEIESDKQQLIGIKTFKAAVTPMQKIIRTVGRVEYNEKLLATVNTKIEGWIEKLYVDYTGRYVKKGEPLAEIFSPELVATQQEFLNVLKWTKQSTEHKSQDTAGLSGIDKMLSQDAENLLEVAKQRLRLWDITDEQINAIEVAGKPVRTLTIYSPANGYVVQKMAVQGMKVMPGEKLFDLADLSTVWVIADIYEYDISSIQLGQKANISLSYFPGKVFSAAIDYVYPSLSNDTRTVKVRFSLANSSAQLKPQMFTNVEIKINMGKRLSIPEDAVIDTGMRQVIYVDVGDDYFEPREVHIGLTAEGMTEVLHGLEAGEKVVSSGTFLIDSEAKLKGIKPLNRTGVSK